MRNVKFPDTSEQPVLLVTGLSGNMGRRLAAHLPDRRLVGVDLFSPQFDHPQMQFSQLDLSASDAPAKLAELMTRSNVRQVVHLAFVLDPARTGARTRRRQWEINVLGTKHLLDAIERVNKAQRQVELLLYLSSVTSYGPMLPGPVREDHPQKPHTYTYALHKKETDELCLRRHPQLNGCGVYIVRGHIFLGVGVENFIVRALQRHASGRSWLGRWLQRRGWRLPLLLPWGRKYGGLYQFMDIDDVARLLAWLCKNYVPGRLEVLNAQGRGAPVTGEQLARLVGLSILRLPSYRLVRLLYQLFWALGISPVPAEAYPYFAGSYVMNTSKLEQLLGKEYEIIVRCTTEEAVRKIANPDSH